MGAQGSDLDDKIGAADWLRTLNIGVHASSGAADTPIGVMRAEGAKFRATPRWAAVGRHPVDPLWAPPPHQAETPKTPSHLGFREFEISAQLRARHRWLPDFMSLASMSTRMVSKYARPLSDTAPFCRTTWSTSFVGVACSPLCAYMPGQWARSSKGGRRPKAWLDVASKCSDFCLESAPPALCDAPAPRVGGLERIRA